MPKKKQKQHEPTDIDITNTTSLIFSTEYRKLLDVMVYDLVTKGYHEDYVHLIDEMEKKLHGRTNLINVVSLSYILARILSHDSAKNFITSMRERNDIAVQ